MIIRRPSLDTALRLSFILTLLLGWLLASRVMPQYLLPSPQRVLADMLGLITTPGLRRHVIATLLHILSAVGISILLGFALVLLVRAVPLLAVLVEQRLTPLANAFPAIGWTFLGVLWFGLDTGTVIFAICAMLLPFNIINISQGLRVLDTDLLEMATSFTTHPLRRFALVTFPMLVPFLLATMRLNLGVAWKVALTAELLGGNRGLGFLMNLAMQDQDTVRLLSISVLILLFVYVMDVRMLAPAQNRFDRRFR